MYIEENGNIHEYGQISGTILSRLTTDIKLMWDENSSDFKLFRLQRKNKKEFKGDSVRNTIIFYDVSSR